MECFGFGPLGPDDVIDSAISTSTAAADKDMKVGGAQSEAILASLAVGDARATDVPFLIG
jgi:hypothetical protein